MIFFQKLDKTAVTSSRCGLNLPTAKLLKIFEIAIDQGVKQKPYKPGAPRSVRAPPVCRVRGLVNRTLNQA